MAASQPANAAPSTWWKSASRSQRRAWLGTSLVLGDALSIVIAGLAATWVRFGVTTARVTFENTSLSISFWEVAVVVVPLWIVFLAFAKLYDVDTIAWGLSAAGRITRTISLGVVALILVTYLLKMPGLSRAWTLTFWLFAIVAVLAMRGLLAFGVAYARQTGRMLSSTLVVGANAEAADIIRVLQSDHAAGLVPIGCLTSSQAERLELDFCSGNLPVLGSAREILDVVASTRVDSVVIASSAFDHDVLARMIAELRTADVDVHISSGLFEVLTSRVLVNEIAGVPLITVKGVSLSKGNLFTKRVFDLAISLLVVIVGLPIWLAIALAIKLTSRGPVLYSQPRIGRGGRPFQMYKFRSMFVDAEDRLGDVMAGNEASGPLFKMRDDPRVTPVGRWLRKFSVDEIPQVLNVVRGEMSLVGPRPPLKREVALYSSQDWRRLEVLPGMTGLWQVSGRSSLTFEEMVRLDVFYIENWSVSLDMTLIFRTIPAVLFARGAY